jgi:RHS repeat-associated protein
VNVDSGGSITSLTVNNQNAAHSNGMFTKDNLQLSYGENQTITARVTDSRGYTTTCTVTLHYDPMADEAFAYDLRGNMVYKSEHGEETLYIYDQRNYLKEAQLPNGDIVRLSTDAQGRRLKREFYDASVATWSTINYFLDGVDTLADFTGSWSVNAYYINGPSIDHIEIMRTGGADYYFIRDHLGSVRVLVDSSASIAEQYDYSPYGEFTIKDASNAPLSQSAVGNRFTFTGRELDNQINLYYYRQRYYSPIFMKFLSSSVYSKDLEESYAYAGNSPIGLKDPFGLMKTKNCCNPKKLKKGETDPDQIPEDKYFENEVNMLVSNPKIKNCIKSRMKKTTITCMKDNEAPCNNPYRAPMAQGEVGFLWGLYKGNSVTWCGGNMTQNNCGPKDRAKLLIHEFAHNCGLPAEGINGDWDVGGKMSKIAPGKWGASGVPGTTTGGEIDCIGN